MGLSGTDSQLSHTSGKPGSEQPFRPPGEGRGAPTPSAPASRNHSMEEAQVKRSGWRNPFKSLFGATRREQYVERYVLREHEKGRAFAEILEDPYVRAWSTPQERARLLERPTVIAAVGEHAVADLRAAIARAGT
jgi:hypothetical protein